MNSEKAADNINKSKMPQWSLETVVRVCINMVSFWHTIPISTTLRVLVSYCSKNRKKKKKKTWKYTAFCNHIPTNNKLFFDLNRPIHIPSKPQKQWRKSAKLIPGIRNYSQWLLNRLYLIVPYDLTVHSNSEQTSLIDHSTRNPYHYCPTPSL